MENVPKLATKKKVPAYRIFAKRVTNRNKTPQIAPGGDTTTDSAKYGFKLLNNPTPEVCQFPTPGGDGHPSDAFPCPAASYSVPSSGPAYQCRGPGGDGLRCRSRHSNHSGRKQLLRHTTATGGWGVLTGRPQWACRGQGGHPGRAEPAAKATNPVCHAAQRSIEHTQL